MVSRPKWPWTLLGVGDLLGALVGAVVWLAATTVQGSFSASTQPWVGGWGLAVLIYLVVLAGTGGALIVAARLERSVDPG